MARLLKEEKESPGPALSVLNCSKEPSSLLMDRYLSAFAFSEMYLDNVSFAQQVRNATPDFGRNWP